MPRTALALALFWFVSLFVFRSILQWRRTGSTGIKPIRGKIGSLPWWVGILATVGLVGAPLAPVAALWGWPGGTLFFASPTFHLLGTALGLAGILGALAAQLDMGNSWRVGVDPDERTDLVMTGFFGWTRNPIFSFITLSIVGFWLVVPNTVASLAVAAVLFGIEFQVRAVEEPYLQRVHGDRYLEYAARVGRFVPGIGRIESESAGLGRR